MSLSETYNDTSAASIEKFGKRLISKTLRGVEGVHRIPKKYLDTAQGVRTKGSFGSFLERFYFGINPPNTSEPDFPRAGVELKSTPLKKLKNGKFSAKERLVLNLINYHQESQKDFRSSSFYKKNAEIMLVAYLYEEQRAVVDYLVKVAELISLNKLSKEDRIIIERDWRRIVDKIRAGRADELSEGDTLYLGACTKAANSKVFTTAPGNIKAKPRAFAFKQGFMTTLLNGLLDAEPVVKSALELSGLDLEALIEKRFEPFLGLSVAEIKERIAPDLNAKSKDFYAQLARRMMGIKKRKIEEFEKADVVMKTVRLGINGLPREDMSFPAFSYMELIDEKWDETERGKGAPSFIKIALEKKFFFVAYQCGKDPSDLNSVWLKKVMFWNMPKHDLEEVKRVWRETVMRIMAGEADRLPGSTESSIMHVRPHGRNGKDVLPTPRNGPQVKKCFWLNRAYVGKVLRS